MAIRLFDDSERSYYGPIGYSETKFEYLNRSAHEWTGNVRDTFEFWFGKFPEDKKRDLHSRIRSGDDHMLGASLEIVTHAILEAIAIKVIVEPHLAGGRPDFQASHQQTIFAVECTVAQESDSDVRGSRRENTVKDLINSIDSRDFKLLFNLRESSQKQLPARKLRRELRRWLESLDPESERHRIERGGPSSTFPWCEYGWSIQFTAIPVNTRRDPRAIGAEIQGPSDATENYTKLGRALKGKADVYRSIELPYLVVAGSATSIQSDDEELFETLFGPWYCKIDRDLRAIVFEGRRWDALWGSPDRPRNRHVSAVLYTPWREPWGFCARPLVFSYPPDAYFETFEEALAANDIETDEPSQWRLAHNPWAAAPLPRGLFPFAKELYSDSSERVSAEPQTTLNHVLGLPDPWPGHPLQSEMDAWYESRL